MESSIPISTLLSILHDHSFIDFAVVEYMGEYFMIMEGKPSA
jgi:hypothetical protein